MIHCLFNQSLSYPDTKSALRAAIQALYVTRFHFNLYQFVPLGFAIQKFRSYFYKRRWT